MLLTGYIIFVYENYTLFQFNFPFDVRTNKFMIIINILGIPFKTQPSEQSMMHHKFCLIDKEDPELAKVLFGSLNLTAQALTKNFDAFIITNNLNILKRFSEEFEDLWEEF